MVTVLIPWYGDCPYRTRALEWVVSRYGDRHPTWRIEICEGGDPWVKADAVMPAVERVRGGVIVVADADVWCDETDAAVDAVAEGAGWAMPHAAVHRLSVDGSAAYMNGRPWRDFDLDQRPYRGVLGGGIVVSTRKAFLTAPLDPRFVGWGQEDTSWGCALTTLIGTRWRGNAPLIHLWHPPARRIGRVKGSTAGWALYRRYVKASTDPEAMRALIGEINGDCRPSDEHLHDHAPRRIGHG